MALGTAKGLLYLHEGCQRRIIHRDIKAANILLTEDFEPQVVYLETVEILYVDDMLLVYFVVPISCFTSGD